MTHEPTAVAVIAGGLSHEREISLQSGQQVAAALESTGHPVDIVDVDSDMITRLRSADGAVVFPMLHGSLGEDGAIQTVCEALDLPYVGSTAAAAHLAFDKQNAKVLANAQDVRVPTSFTVNADLLKLVGAAKLLPEMQNRLGYPMVVKPQRGGSSLGLSVIHHADELTGALVHALAYDSSVLLEQFIAGREIAVSVLQDVPGWERLPPVEIIAGNDGYDYAARYTVGETTFRTPAVLDDDVRQGLHEAATHIHRGLGLRDYSRSDFIVDEHNRFWFLEVNCAPGMTVNSLLPQAVRASGRTLGELCSDLVTAAAHRHAQQIG